MNETDKSTSIRLIVGLIWSLGIAREVFELLEKRLVGVSGKV